MGITERHWFEDEEPELTEQQLEDIVAENQRSYEKGYADAMKNAVPLDKLCDVLSSHSLDIFTAEHCCLMSKEFWKSKIIEWMDGLDVSR